MQSLQIALVLLFLGTAALAAWTAEPEDFVAAMEENNSQWLQAYSNQNAEVLGSMYAEDAMLIAASKAEPLDWTRR